MAESVHADVVAKVLAEHAGEPGALLAILHGIQDALGFVPPSAVPDLARAQGLSRAEVEGVLAFYRDFRTAPPARRVIRLCRAEACQAAGADGLLREAEERLRISLGTAREDGEVALEAVYCLGNCALGPSAMVDGQLHGRVDGARLEELLREKEPGGRP
jgi:formate dehydrogenase subunit gamma